MNWRCVPSYPQVDVPCFPIPISTTTRQNLCKVHEFSCRHLRKLLCLNTCSQQHGRGYLGGPLGEVVSMRPGNLADEAMCPEYADKIGCTRRQLTAFFGRQGGSLGIEPLGQVAVAETVESPLPLSEELKQAIVPLSPRIEGAHGAAIASCALGYILDGFEHGDVSPTSR